MFILINRCNIQGLVWVVGKCNHKVIAVFIILFIRSYFLRNYQIIGMAKFYLEFFLMCKISLALALVIYIHNIFIHNINHIQIKA